MVFIVWACAQHNEELVDLHSSSEMGDIGAFPVLFDESQPPDSLSSVVERDDRGIVKAGAVRAETGSAYVYDAKAS